MLTDWTLITDSVVFGQPLPARAWGAEHLDDLSRAERILDAGCDQFGGEARPELIIQLVESGRVALSRLDQSARRLLAAKLALGLFDSRHVDPHRAGRIVGNAEFITAGLDAQRRSHTLLTNRDDLLPLGRGVRIYVENIDPEIACHYAQLVDTPQEADVAVIRL